MNETPNKPEFDISKSEELRMLFRALAAAQSNAIVRVMRGRDAEEMKELITKELKKLEVLQRESPAGRCGPGEVWDEMLGRCV